MADIRRHSAEPPPGMPRIQHTPGVADELMRELAPLLAQDGIDVDNPQAYDIDTLQAALNRAVERRNMELFTPVGPARTTALTAVKAVVMAIVDGDGATAGELLELIEPESPDNSTATVSSCIGIAVGLMDDWLPGDNFASRIQLPCGHWVGERAATDILALASKGKAFKTLGKLIVNHGGHHMLAGSLLALAATITAEASHTSTPISDLIQTRIR